MLGASLMAFAQLLGHGLMAGESRQLDVSVYLACFEGHPAVEFAIANLTDHRVAIPDSFAPWNYLGKGMNLRLDFKGSEDTLSAGAASRKSRGIRPGRAKVWVDAKEKAKRYVRFSEMFGDIGGVFAGRTADLTWEYSYPPGFGVPSDVIDLGGWSVDEASIKRQCDKKGNG